ncbi:MAG: hypothetical protein NZT61_02170 [Deltaproteobacteria bacterium]|nr:hypothetical protein [Deltaproteobacteria bacterium]
MKPEEFELQLQKQLTNLFLKVKDNLFSGKTDQTVIDEIEEVTKKISENRTKIIVSNLPANERKIINMTIEENRKLLNEILQLVEISIETVEQLKRLCSEKDSFYRPFLGKIITE